MLPRHLTVDGVIDRGPAELLRARGFRRKGRNFHRLRAELVDSVYFQTARGAPFQFCVSLSLILPYHHEQTRGAPLPDSPSSDNSSWLVNTRVSFPTGKEEQHWLAVTPSQSAAAVAATVTSALPAALEVFDAFRSVDDVIAAYRSGSELVEDLTDADFAILLAYAGHAS